MVSKGLIDDNGIIQKACKNLPEEYIRDFMEALSELEDNEAHRTRTFPKTRLHKVEGAKNVYRADIDKVSGWRLHVIYGEDSRIHLCDVLEGKEHDRVIKVIKTRKNLYKE